MILRNVSEWCSRYISDLGTIISFGAIVLAGIMLIIAFVSVIMLYFQWVNSNER